jgi:hypothetical protein
MEAEYEELARIAANVARAALRDWSPQEPDSTGRLAGAIGEAVAIALARQEEIRARLTASRMAGLNPEEELHNWQI